MENFKISVDVNVKFSEETIKALASIFANATAAHAVPAKPAPTATPAPTPAPTIAPAANTAKPVPTQTSAPATPAASAPAPAAKSASISIDEVRAALAKKVNAHREEIKEKLTELGAPSVTKLDSSKYEEMLNFLNSLD